MRKKDFDNTYKKEPETLTDKIEQATGTYTNADENGWTELKNRNFVQMNKDFQEDILELMLSEPTASAVLTFMACNMEDNNTYIVKQTTLAKTFHKGVSTIERVIKVLKERDFLMTFKLNRTNVYFINPRVYCKVSASYKDKLIAEYAKLNQDLIKPPVERHVDLTVIKETEKERLIYKKDFSKTNPHLKLRRPDNYAIFKMNQLKEILNILDEDDELYLKKKYINRETPTAEELRRWNESLRLMQKHKELIKKQNTETAETDNLETSEPNETYEVEESEEFQKWQQEQDRKWEQEYEQMQAEYEREYGQQDAL